MITSQFSLIGKGNLNTPDILALPTRTVVGIQAVQPHYGFRVESNITAGDNLTDRLLNHVPSLQSVYDASLWNLA